MFMVVMMLMMELLVQFEALECFFLFKWHNIYLYLYLFDN